MDDFYSTIPVIEDLKEFANLEKFIDIPESWFIAIAKAITPDDQITEQKYKEINTIAVASIAAVLNTVKNQRIPYVFNGYGSVIAFPSEFKNDVESSLAGIRELARGPFGIELNIGLIPVSVIYQDGVGLKVSKLRLAGKTTQAIFSGGGINYSERLLDIYPERYMVDETSKISPDFSGFECRWDKIQAKSEEVVTIIAQARNQQQESQVRETYMEVLNKIEEIYGNSENRSPISLKDLSLTLNPELLNNESKIKNVSTGNLLAQNLAVKTLGNLGMEIDGVKWEEYRKDVVKNTNNEDFDDLLKFVITGKKSDRERLIQFLEELYKSEKIYYGIHTSQAVNMTCIVFNRLDDHIHFIDGNDGGYIKAKINMSKQMSN